MWCRLLANAACNQPGFHTEPEPHSNFAKVFVDGEFLGVSTNVESIKKPWLGRHFESDRGNLYEANLSDFSDNFSHTWQQKTNKRSDSSGSDLAAVLAVLNVTTEETLRDTGCEEWIFQGTGRVTAGGVQRAGAYF